MRGPQWCTGGETGECEYVCVGVWVCGGGVLVGCVVMCLCDCVFCICACVVVCECACARVVCECESA